MKKNILLGSMLFLSTTLFAEVADVKVKGMVCAFCAHGLSKQFSENTSVEAVKVTLKDRNIHLKIKKGSVLDDEAIKKIVEDTGYTLESITRKAD